MNLTPGQWQAVDAIVSQHARNPALAEAVEKACADAWRHVEKCGMASANEIELGQEKDGPGRAGNTTGNLAHQPITPEGGWHQ